jgi:DNA (cytosine-5)-methyltransferase 1
VRAPALRLHHDELIVDNFAGGGGASLGIEWGLGRSPDIAINHDPEAIAMHAANHPGTRHYCEDVWKVDPREACRGRKVALAWFSPDCKHFSKAKGGKPVDKKIRGLAWIVIRWAKAVRPRVICLENVEEFEDWGPLLDNGKPCPERVGLTFRIWRGKLEALGYKVEHRELVAADYGTPTTRKRLFLVARCDGLPIVWPAPTHGRGREPWRTAAECIDWALPTYSIFLTKHEARPYKIVRPLAENTMRRIARGLKKFVIDNPEPFIVPVMHGAEPRVWDINEPMRTITGAHRGDRALITPLIAKFRGDSAGSAADAPMPTVTAGPKANPAGAAHALGLITPYVARIGQTGGNGDYVNRADAPVTTITSKAEHLVVAPTLITTGYGERPGQAPRAPGLDKPLGTIVNCGKHALVGAFLAKHYGDTGQRPGSGMVEPVATITASDHNALVTSQLTNFYTSNTEGGQGDLFKPMKTIAAGGNHQAEVRAFLVKYYGGNDAIGVDVPMRTITALERFGLVAVHGEPYVITDIGMRMLAPRELYRAQGFPIRTASTSRSTAVACRRKRRCAASGIRCARRSPLRIARAQFEDQVIEVAA